MRLNIGACKPQKKGLNAMKKLSTMTNEDFNRLLCDLIDKHNVKASQLLSVPGVYEILSEEYNNEIIDAFMEEN